MEGPTQMATKPLREYVSLSTSLQTFVISRVTCFSQSVVARFTCVYVSLGAWGGGNSVIVTVRLLCCLSRIALPPPPGPMWTS